MTDALFLCYARLRRAKNRLYAFQFREQDSNMNPLWIPSDTWAKSLLIRTSNWVRSRLRASEIGNSLVVGAPGMRQARRLVRGDAVDDAPADADPTDPHDDKAEG